MRISRITILKWKKKGRKKGSFVVRRSIGGGMRAPRGDMRDMLSSGRVRGRGTCLFL